MRRKCSLNTSGSCRREYSGAGARGHLLPSSPRCAACGTRLNSVFSAGAGWPDDVHCHVAFAGGVDHVGGSAVASCGSAVPDGEEFVGEVEHSFAGAHVRLGGGVGEWELVYGGGLGEEGVVFRVGCRG